MSTSIYRKSTYCHQSMLERLELFRKKLSSMNIDINSTKGLSAAATYNYRTKGNIPKGDSLEEWGTTFGLSLNWLLWGEGEMLRTHKGNTPPKDESNLSTGSLQKIEQLTKALESERAEKLRLMSMNEQLTKEVLQFNQFLRERFGWDEEMEGKPDVFHYGLPDSAHATKKLVRGVDTPDNDNE